MEGGEIAAEALRCHQQGVLRYSVVTSGKRLSDREVEQVCDSLRRIRSACAISLCASNGLLSQAQLQALKAAGLTPDPAEPNPSWRDAAL